MNSYLNIAEGVCRCGQSTRPPVSINVAERVSGLTFIRGPSAKMRAIVALFFVWTWGRCLPAPTDMRRQDVIDRAASIQVDDYVHSLQNATTAVPKSNQSNNVLKVDDGIPARNMHVKSSAVDVDTANKKVVVKVPCRRTSNNPCLGSEIYEFVLLKAEGLAT